MDASVHLPDRRATVPYLRRVALLYQAIERARSYQRNPIQSTIRGLLSSFHCTRLYREGLRPEGTGGRPILKTGLAPLESPEIVSRIANTRCLGALACSHNRCASNPDDAYLIALSPLEMFSLVSKTFCISAAGSPRSDILSRAFCKSSSRIALLAFAEATIA